MDKKLYDVYVIRPIAIFLLIVYHSFIIYRGGWSQPHGYQYIGSYDIIATLCSAFRLELLVFCSGYLFALTLLRKRQTFQEIVKTKAKRLLLPSIIFSVIYFFLLYDISKYSFLNGFIKILSGAGHLWYLPMLFWVMLLSYAIDKRQWKIKSKILVCMFLPILSLVPIPFQINRAFYYIIYFYFGMLIYRNREVIMEKIKNWKQVIICGILFVIVYAIGLWIKEGNILTINKSSSLIEKTIIFEFKQYVKIVYCILGIVFIYVLVNYFLEVKKIIIKNWVIKLSELCFGIYLFQQFILQILYYKTSLPSIVGPYWLPWIGLVVTLVLSYVLTKLSLKTKLGRQLM